MPSQILERISIRWLPEPAYEDTKTIALYVGDYFMDLRVQIGNGAIQWARTGNFRVLKQMPLTCEWSHIIDSLGLTEPDVATFTKLPNGDDLESGTYKNPNKGGALSEYEEVWRDVTGPRRANESAWILQSTDGSTFLGFLNGLYLGLRLAGDGSFEARREERTDGQGAWTVIFESPGSKELPSVANASLSMQEQIGKLEVDDHVELVGTGYIIRALARA